VKTNWTFGVIFGLALVLALSANAQPGGTATTPGSQAKSTEPLILDLSKFQKEKFVTNGKTNELWQSLVGRQVYDGLPFMIEGWGCVYGSKLGPEKEGETPTYPDLIGIPVGRQFEELHLLHLSQWAEVEGQEIATIRLDYADGTKHEFPILFGGHVRDWQRMAPEEKELLTDPNTKIIWRGPGMQNLHSTMRLFKSMLANPHPEKVVTAMDVVSTKHLAGYTLVAATVANHDASLPVTPPSPSAEPERHFDGAMMIRVTEHGSGQPVPGALVQPGMVVDETGLIGIPFLTSATGEGVVRYPVGRTTRISVSVEKEGYGSGNDSLELAPGPTNRLEVELTVPPKVTGVVRDGAGVPLAGVEMMVWPPWGGTSKGGTTDTNGHFLVIRNLPDGNNPYYEQYLIARDLRRNLAFAQSIEESTTNVDLRLEPGLAVTGFATDAKGKPLPKAEAEIMFWTEHMGSTMGKSVPADSEGRFEIKALPPGRHYGLIVSAKGYGRVTHDVAQEAEGRRIELGPFELALADQRIAGVVLGADDKPVTGASIFGYGEGQPSVNGKTDAKGRFSFSGVCAGPIQLQANSPSGGFGNVSAEGGDTNITVQLGTSGTVVDSRSSIKIGGTVTGPDDKPAPQVRVSLFPSFSPGEKQTDSDGRFMLTFDPRQSSAMGAATPIVVARDPVRNLAAAADLEEGATNASVRLEPALTLAGRITDPDGKALTNAQAQLWFHTERMASNLGSPVRADVEGRFEIKALPPGRQYTVNASAKGFGQEQRNVPASDTATNRMELEPFQLVRADQRIAGVVLDDEEKPVPRASIYSYGARQPNLNAQTDAKGQFSMDKVCAGPIQLSANSRNGGYANVTAEGGDTNIVIRISTSRVVRRAEPQTAHLKGKPLPDLASLGLTTLEAPVDQPLLAVLVDAEQRPSRRTLRLLGEQAATIKDKGVNVIVVHTGTMADEDFKAWKQEAALPFPIVSLKGDAEKARAAWGAGALPWLILTDKGHRVTAEGFTLEELDARIKDVGK
jgi:protocatechuate 3,4-dioxygenase beta subunit